MMVKSMFKKIKKLLFGKKIVPLLVPVMEGKYLEGHIAFIVGGSGGIGRAIAERFIANGCKVIISGTNKEKIVKTATELGNDTEYVIMNLFDLNSIRNGCREAIEKAGKIDILVNSAGIHGPSDFWTISENDWNSVMDTNVKGMFFTSQILATYMREQKIRGHILNISSASALKHGKTPYEISKNAVRAMTLGMAEECIKYGIVVNCLGPGPTATNMLHMNNESELNWSGNPSGRVARPEEIANWAVYLASSLGDYVVGDSLYVSGGSGTICIDK